MRKTVVLALLASLIVCVSTLSAEPKWTDYSPSFNAGSLAVQGGIGLGYSMPGTVNVPPVGAAVDYAVRAGDLPFSFGAYVGYASSKETFSYFGYDWSYEYSYVIIAGRAAYHVDFGVKNLDTYAGLLLGYAIANASVSGTAFPGQSAATAGGIALGGYLGARYFFTPRFGAFAELGYSVGYLSLGVAYKI